MNRYTNSYFKIKINFPDTWNFRYWGNRKTLPPFPDRFQKSDNDLPTESHPEKELFNSRSRIRRKSFLGTGVDLISLYRPNGFSLQEFRVEIESDLKREFQLATVAGVEIQSLYIESQGDGFILYTKIYCWQHDENIWLFCGIRSDALEGFEEAKGIARQVMNGSMGGHAEYTAQLSSIAFTPR